jgi:hypothetical protein
LSFPAPREKWKEETKEETKRRHRGWVGFCFLGAVNGFRKQNGFKKK